MRITFATLLRACVVLSQKKMRPNGRPAEGSRAELRARPNAAGRVQPWGGFKGSGYGRDVAIYSLNDFTRTKHVQINHTR